jgi:RNA polymerase sigma factor (sigma-70 family)
MRVLLQPKSARGEPAGLRGPLAINLCLSRLWPAVLPGSKLTETVPDNTVQKAVGGDQEALARLLERHGEPLWRIIDRQISRRYRQRLSPDDVMQQTYADATHHVATFRSDSEAAFAGWLRTIAERNLLDALEAIDKRPVPVPLLDDGLAGAGTTPTRGVVRTERGELLRAAIRKLPEAYARVIELYDLKCRPIEDVATELQRSQGAVYMLRRRALERLHELLGPTGNFFTTDS